MKKSLSIPLLVVLVMALSGCALIADKKSRLRETRVDAAAALEPVPAVRVLVSWDASDSSIATIDSIVLLDPAGHEYLPSADDRRESRQPISYRAWPTVRGSGNGARVPDNFSLVLPDDRRGDIIKTTAVIEIPNINAYRQLSDQWTVAVVLSDPEGKTRSITIPAPPLQRR